MALTALLVVTIGTLLARIVAALPPIIWAFRCPADSPHYKCPPPAGLFRVGKPKLRRVGLDRTNSAAPACGS